MPNDLAHFAIHADDVDRARSFYEAVFGWSFRPWGPPGFWMIETSPGAPHGSLQRRREPARGGLAGFECTFAVDDPDAVAAAVEEAGGSVTTPPFDLTGVGRLVMFRDTEGNSVGAMRYAQPDGADR